MSKSPLSGAFGESKGPEKKKKKGGALLIVAGVGLAASLGGVFAANSITINGGNDIQFGQGVAATNSCVSALTTKLTQDFANATTSFVARNVQIDGTFTSCGGKDLKVDLRNASGQSQAGFTVRVLDADSGSPTSVQVLRNAGTYTYDVSSLNIDAGNVKKITVTTE